MQKLKTAREMEETGILPLREAGWRAKARVGLIPSVKCGRRVLFDMAQVDDWIRSGGRGLDALRCESAPDGAGADTGREAASRA